MKLIHVNEPKHTSKVTLRQAELISRIKPDAILFEWPASKHSTLKIYNKYKPRDKPDYRIKRWKAAMKISSKRYPWFKTFHKVITAIENLWKDGRQVYLYEIDAPAELTGIGYEKLNKYANMVWCYLREVFMVENIRTIESIFKRRKKDTKIMLLCANFHWNNIQFLLKRPSKNEIWKHYFVGCGFDSPKDLTRELKDKNKIIYKYWKLKSTFC